MYEVTVTRLSLSGGWHNTMSGYATAQIIFLPKLVRTRQLDYHQSLKNCATNNELSAYSPTVKMSIVGDALVLMCELGFSSPNDRAQIERDVKTSFEQFAAYVKNNA